MEFTTSMPAVSAETDVDAGSGDLTGRRSVLTDATADRSSVPGIAVSTSTASVASLDDEHDVIIVGGGLSGLVAAQRITEKEPNLRILILEKNDRVGGRVCPVQVSMGADRTEHHDVGGQVFSTDHTGLRRLLVELGLSEDEVSGTGGERISHFAESGIVRHSGRNVPIFGYELGRFMDLISILGHEPSSLSQLDNISLDTFMKQQCLSISSYLAIEALLNSILGVNSWQISALYFVSFVSATSGLRSMFSCTQKQVKGSTRALLDALMDRMYFFTKTDKEVMSIDIQKDEINVKTRSGDTYRARHVILAVPPQDVLKIWFHPELPEGRTEMLRLFVPGHMTKSVFAYKESFWSKMGLCGTAFCGLGGPISMLHNSSIHSGGYHALAAVTGGSPSLRIASLTQDKRQEQQIEQLVEWFGPKSRHYVGVAERLWPQAGGAFAPGANALCIKYLRNPVNRLHWAGTETSVRWPGFMEGAVVAGEWAALEVLRELRPQMIAVQDDFDLDSVAKALDDLAASCEDRRWRRLKHFAAWSAVTLVVLYIWKRLTNR